MTDRPGNATDRPGDVGRDDPGSGFPEVPTGGLVVAVVLLVGASAVLAGLAAADHDEFEPNDSLSQATEIEAGNHENLHINSGEYDYYAIDLAENQRMEVDIYFDHVDGDVDIGLQDPDENFVNQSISTTDDESVSLTATQSGTHYVVVYGYTGPNTYDMEITVRESFFEPEIVDTNDPVIEGDRLLVTAEVENTGELQDEQEVELFIDGESIESSTVELSSGQSETIDFVVATDELEPDTYTAVVRTDDTLTTADVTIEAEGFLARQTPGFGPVVAIVALLGTALLAGRRLA